MELISGILGVRLCRPPSGDGVTERRLELLEAEPLTASVGIAGMKKKGEPISGDRGTYFKTDSGVLCVILADGMGSGTDAARESINAVRTLEGFLRAGVDPSVQ
jgi:stage II sporulation protein E